MRPRIKNLLLLLVLLTGFGLMSADQVVAQTFNTLYAFTAPDPSTKTNCDGYGPSCSMVLSADTLYGATELGGAWGSGTIFAIGTNGSGFTNLLDFPAVNEPYGKKNPTTGLVLSGNTLYGATTYGGTNVYGSIFVVTTNGVDFHTLHNFSDADGAYPESGLITCGNSIYGTTAYGGTYTSGSIFEINKEDSTFNTVLDYPNPAGGYQDGADLQGLVQSGNTFYGTALIGGSNNCGTVFSVCTNGAGLNLLHSFAYTEGSGPMSGLVISGNTLYGTAENGGSYGYGSIFSINTNGTGFTVLHSFTGSSDGAFPNARLIISGNALFGTTTTGSGASTNGTVFYINTNGSYFKVLHTFTAIDPSSGKNNDGAVPIGGLSLSGNTLYGATGSGGVQGYGTIFDISLPMWVNNTSLPLGINGLSYNQSLSAFGGQSPYSWTISSGILPPGLTLTTDGQITGAPTNNGTYNFTVQVTDAVSEIATQALTMVVGGSPGVVWIQPTTNSIVVPVGSNVNLSISVAGTGPFDYQWRLNGNNLPNGIISTVAGNPYYGGSNLGDGGIATSAVLINPTDVAKDAVGNLFIADSGNGRIRKVDVNGVITTVAGNGNAGWSGDGGMATNAEISAPCAVAVDASGNLFIADSSYGLIRKVDTSSIITTVAGCGNGYSGDGGAATNARMSGVSGVAIDSVGNLFIADSNNNRVRKVDTNGIITTVAGNGYTTNINGDIYGGYSGDGGAATNAELDGPIGITIDGLGNLYFTDTANNVIRKVDTNGIITTVAGNGYGAGTLYGGYSGDGGAATLAKLDFPFGVAIGANSDIVIADSANNVIRKVAANGIITTVAGNGYGAGSHKGGYSGDGGAAILAELDFPQGVAMDTNGNLFVADSINNCIRKVSHTGQTLALNNVGIKNVGMYDVVVSSLYGSVTSSVVNVDVPILQVATALLPSGSNGVAYSQQLSAIYGQTPYSWSVVSNALPSGLTLATSGLISGKPTASGTFKFTAKVTDALSATALKTLSLQVIYRDTNSPVLTITSPTPGQLWSNNVYTVTGTAKDNAAVANVFYSVNNGAWINATTGNGWTNWSATVNLVSGTNTIQAYAVDTSGNISTTNSVSFKAILSTALQVRTIGIGSLSPNYSNAVLQVGNNYKMTAKAGKGFAFGRWTVSTNWVGGAITNNATVQFTMVSNLTLQAKFNDVTKPVLKIGKLAAKQTVNPVSVSGTASDNWQMAAVRVGLNGVWTNAVTVNQWTNWSASLNLIPGANQLAIYAVDTSGNCSKTNSKTLTFTPAAAAVVKISGVVNANTLVITDWAYATNGFSLTLQSLSNQNGRVQASTNLTSWETLTNFSGTNTPFNFIDPTAIQTSHKYYRAVSP